MARVNRPKLIFETIEVKKNVPPLDIDKFFMPFNIPLPGYSMDTLEHILNFEYVRLEQYINTKLHILTAYRKNKEKQTKTNQTTTHLIRRFHALSKVKGAADFITKELRKDLNKRCVIFYLSASVAKSAVAYFPRDLKILPLYEGSSPENIDKRQRNFAKGTARALLVPITGGIGLDLQWAKEVYFLEQLFEPRANLRAMEQLYGRWQQPEILVRNFCIPEKLDRRIAELIRSSMDQDVNRLVWLPKEFYKVSLIKYVLNLTIEGESLDDIDNGLAQAAGARLIARMDNPPKLNGSTIVTGPDVKEIKSKVARQEERRIQNEPGVLALRNVYDKFGKDGVASCLAELNAKQYSDLNSDQKESLIKICNAKIDSWSTEKK